MYTIHVIPIYIYKYARVVSVCMYVFRKERVDRVRTRNNVLWKILSKPTDASTHSTWPELYTYIYIYFTPNSSYSIGFFPLSEWPADPIVNVANRAHLQAARFSAVEKMIYLSCHPGNVDKTILANWFIYLYVFMYSFVKYFFDFKNS
jgi:hypothetical protein